MNRMIQQIQKNKWIIRTLYLIGILLVVGPVYYSFKSAIWLDPAIIMTEMESVAKGYIPYKTMHLNYPPLFFYMMVGLKKLFGIPYGFYNFYLFFNYLFLIGSAVCLDVIGRQFSGKKILSDFSAWLYVLVMLKLGADSVMFAVPSVFFGLLSCMLCLLLKEKQPIFFIIIGMIAVCSFLIKQFGAGYFALVLYLIFCFCDKKKWEKSLCFCLGYVIPIVIVLIVFGWEFVESTLLNGYGTTTSALKGEDVSIGFKIARIKEYSVQSIIHSFMIVVSAICLLPIFYEQMKWKEILFCFCGFAGFCMQYYFCGSGHPHYRQYMAPFAILMIPIMTMLDFKKNYVAIVICFVGLFSTMYKPIRNSLKFSLKKPMQHYCEMGRIYQQKQADEICKYVEEGSSIWIANTELLHFYYFTDMATPNMKQVGYSAGPWEITVESATLQVKSADYVLCTPKGGWSDDFDYYLKPLRPYVEGFYCDTLADDMLLYDMRRPNEMVNKD